MCLVRFDSEPIPHQDNVESNQGFVPAGDRRPRRARSVVRPEICLAEEAGNTHSWLQQPSVQQTRQQCRHCSKSPFSWHSSSLFSQFASAAFSSKRRSRTPTSFIQLTISFFLPPVLIRGRMMSYHTTKTQILRAAPSGPRPGAASVRLHGGSVASLP